MAARENFRLETDLRVAADNIAIDAILTVIEDAFGRGSVKSGPDADGNTVASIRCAAAEVDARRVNWLHQQLATLAKYLLEATEVDCSDDTGRESPYRLEPVALPRNHAEAPGSGAGDAPDAPDADAGVADEARETAVETG